VEILKNTATSLNCCASPSRPVLRSVIGYITLLRSMTRRDFIKPEFSLRYASWKHMPYRFCGLLDSCLAAKEYCQTSNMSHLKLTINGPLFCHGRMRVTAPFCE